MTVEVHIRINPRVPNIVWSQKGKSLSRVCGNKEIIYDNFINLLWKETNEEVYEKCIKMKLNDPTNLTIFAYGQTGSGKTHTMLGNKDGIIICCLKDLLELKNLLEIDSVFVSYIEIYNEKMFDLSTNRELKIFNLNNKTVISKLSRLLIKTLEEGINFIQKCELNRKYGYTEFNSRSSRSHTIFQIYYIRNRKECTVNLIDLAGSEKACIEELRRTEGAFINKSLLALCTLINNLKSKKFFGFRDSKLTRVLQPSLDGSTNIVAFCMISPSGSFVEETISTLSFAARLMNLDLKKTESILSQKKIKKQEICDITKDMSKVEAIKSMKHLSLNTTNKSINNLNSETSGKMSQNTKQEIEDILSKMPYKNQFNSLCMNQSLPVFKNIQVKVNNLYKEKDLLLERIRILEEMLTRMLKKNPNKRLKDIYILEKHMFNLKNKTCSRNNP